MKLYLVTIEIYRPYPTAYEYRMPGSSFGTAISRSIKDFRATIGKKRIQRINIKAELLGAMEDKA